MTRVSLFDSPFLLGFEQLERTLDRVSRASADGYPPYNIERLAENGLRITLAVAGFTADDLDVTIEENQLVIRGKQRDGADKRVFLHRGIAARQFQRSFLLAEGIEVREATLAEGLLHVDLIRPEPQLAVRQIRVNDGSSQARRPAVVEVDRDGAKRATTGARRRG
ncbi:MAG: Hsp20 family protein [Alphaproteobacteria bacterium]|nr:Hsp20 family protein [Alphaproteobacteria bacterium]